MSSNEPIPTMSSSFYNMQHLWHLSFFTFFKIIKITSGKKRKVCVEMKHKKNKPEHPLHFSKYNAPLRTRKRGIAFLHVLPSLFFQLEQQPLKPTSLSQGQALLALFLFLRRIKPVSSSGLIPCCPLYLECYPFHMALLVHLHPSDFTLSIPSPETPSLALVSKSTLSSLIWPSHNLPASFCPLP